MRTYIAERSDRVGVAVWVDGDDANEGSKEAALALAAGVAARLLAQGEGVSKLIIDGEAFAVAPRAGRAALDAVLDRLAVFATTTAEVPLEHSLAEACAGLSSLVLISPDATSRRRAVFDDLEKLGLPVRWVVVSSDDASGGERPVRVPQGLVEGSRVIRL